MKYLRPTRYDLYHKALKPKSMIDANTQWFLDFAKWCSLKYDLVNGQWTDKLRTGFTQHTYTTVELLRIYEKFTGTKAPKFQPGPGSTK